MKKLRMALPLLPALLLAGCFHSAAVSVVQNMYEAALVENEELVEAYIDENYLEDKSLEEITEELAADARKMQGVKSMNITEHTASHLNENLTEEMDASYGDNWHYIVAQTGEDSIMTWILLKGETQYYIMDGQKVSVEEYNKEILK